MIIIKRTKEKGASCKAVAQTDLGSRMQELEVEVCSVMLYGISEGAVFL